jgi:hypothetical protein
MLLDILQLIWFLGAFPDRIIACRVQIYNLEAEYISQADCTSFGTVLKVCRWLVHPSYWYRPHRRYIGPKRNHTFTGL